MDGACVLREEFELMKTCVKNFEEEVKKMKGDDRDEIAK